MPQSSLCEGRSCFLSLSDRRREGTPDISLFLSRVFLLSLSAVSSIAAVSRKEKCMRPLLSPVSCHNHALHPVETRCSASGSARTNRSFRLSHFIYSICTHKFTIRLKWHLSEYDGNATSTESSSPLPFPSSPLYSRTQDTCLFHSHYTNSMRCTHMESF